MTRAPPWKVGELVRATRVVVVAVLSVLLIAGTVACSSGSSGAASGGRASARTNLFDTTWPVPTADSWRTSSVASGGLPDGVRSSDLKAESVALGPAPIFGVTYDEASVFVIGGAPHLLDLFTEAQGNELPDRSPAALAKGLAGYKDTVSATPYVAKIDPATMQPEVLELPKGDTPNYPGSIVAHENGMLYVVATATLFEIDPTSFEITRSLELPLNPAKPESTIYNTLQVSARNGDLLLKTSTQQGMGLLVAVDVDTLQVRSQLEAALSNARMTGVLQDGTEYLYLPGDTDTLRFTVTDDGFTLDTGWSKPYRSDGDGTTPGVAMTPTGDHDTVVFPNNNTVLVGVSAPLRDVLAVNQRHLFQRVERERNLDRRRWRKLPAATGRPVRNLGRRRSRRRQRTPGRDGGSPTTAPSNRSGPPTSTRSPPEQRSSPTRSASTPTTANATPTEHAAPSTWSSPTS